MDEQNGMCKTCKPNFKLNTNGLCEQTDNNCLNSQNGQCIECKSGFYRHISGKCNPLPPNCGIANFQTGDCLECLPNFQSARPGAPCLEIKKIENCQVTDPTNPSKCLIC